MITYITDASGKTHAYPTEDYILTPGQNVVQVSKWDGSKGPVIAEFYRPICWWVSDPMEAPGRVSRIV